VSVKNRLRNGLNRVRLGFTAMVQGERFIQKALGRQLQRMGRRAPAYAGRLPPPSSIVDPQWDYVMLFKTGQTHHILRRIHEAIIRECMRNGGEVTERFRCKCVKCGSEYKKEVDSCLCGGKVREPDPLQKPVLEAFLKNPNRDDEWIDILVSLLRFNLAVDDWYLFVSDTPSVVDLTPYGYGEKLETSALQVYVEDSRYIRVCANRYGRIGNEEFFCPKCYDSEKADTYYDLDYLRKHNGKCPRCKGELVETAYIWREVQATQIKGRFSRTEIIHGNLDCQLPHLYGLPKTVACLRPLSVLRHMVRFNLENYAAGKVAKMVFITGMRQEEVNSMILDAKQQAENKIERSLITGQRGPPKLHTLVVGIDDSKATVTTVDAMPEPDKMQSLEWYKQHVEDVCGIFGVTPKFEGIAEAGKQGVRMVVDVDNAVAEMYQKGITDVLDEQLWPRLGVTDWVWRFNPVEPRDELLDARIKQLNVDTAIKAARANMNVEVEETGELKVSGVPSGEIPQFGEQQQEGMEVKMPGESPSGVESPWDRKKEESWIVTKLNKPGESGRAGKSRKKNKSKTPS